jgi:hypothetical protein
LVATPGWKVTATLQCHAFDQIKTEAWSPEPGASAKREGRPGAFGGILLERASPASAGRKIARLLTLLRRQNLRDAKLEIDPLVERGRLGLVDRGLELLDLGGVWRIGHYGSHQVLVKLTEGLSGVLSRVFGENGSNLLLLGIGQVEALQHWESRPSRSHASKPSALRLRLGRDDREAGDDEQRG